MAVDIIAKESQTNTAYSAILCDKETALEYLTSIKNSPDDDIRYLFKGEVQIIKTQIETLITHLEMSSTKNIEDIVDSLDEVRDFFNDNLYFDTGLSDYHCFIDDYDTDREAYFDAKEEEEERD